MSIYEMHRLQRVDGSWGRFLADWSDQCDQVGDAIEDYATDALSAMTEIADSPDDTALSKTWIAAIHNGDRFVAAAYLNWARLPKSSGPTLRVRQIVVSPFVDYGTIDADEYGNILVSLVFEIVKLSESDLMADSVKLHLRSPHDMLFFKAFGNALDSKHVFTSVEMRGAWLYIEKSGISTSTADHREGAM